MNSQILLKIHSFLKHRLIELFGVLLLLISIFLLASVVSYSPNDPNFIYTPENAEIKNIGGFYGSVISDFLLQSLGLISILLIINFFYWGIKIISQKKINNFIIKIFFTLTYILFGTTVLSIVYNDWTRGGSYLFSSEPVVSAHINFGEEILVVNPESSNSLFKATACNPTFLSLLIFSSPTPLIYSLSNEIDPL